MNAKSAARELVEAFVESKKADTVAMLYHSLVEATLHPYNRDAIDDVRRSVGLTRYQRERNRMTNDPAMKQLALDAEAVLASLGIEPIEHTESEDAKYHAKLAGLLGEAESALREALPTEFGEEAEAGLVN